MPAPRTHPSKKRNDSNETMALIGEILSLLSQVSDKFEPQQREMRQWMAQNIRNPFVGELLQDTTPMMLRVVDAIGQSEPVNGITISKQSGIPKGSVSKITRRLLAQKLILSESLPNNKKEIHFRLTPLGRELFQAHRAFDKQMEKGFVQFLQKYNVRQLRFAIRVLHDLVETSFLNPPH